MIFGTHRSPLAIYFGSGQRRALPRIVRPIGQRALICSDSRFGDDLYLTAIRDDLSRSGVTVEVYDRTIAELPLSCVAEAAEVAKDFGPAVVIGLGGGSCIDLAKLVALKLAHEGPLSDFYGEFKVPGPVAPVIAVPTTSGTGSEVTPVAVLADPDRAMKIGISSPYLIPTVAVCDPELTLTCPARLTAIAGADALTHAIEAFTARRREVTWDLPLDHVFIGKNAMSDAFACQAISALSKNLARAVQDGQDLAARERTMYGALAAGQAFGVAGTAAAHAIQYPIGALTHTPHGLGVAVLMPYVMSFNRNACVGELAEIGRLFGVAADGDDDLADGSIEAVASLFASIGLPSTLKDLGLDPDRVGWSAEQTLASARLVKNNPRDLDRAAAERIIRAAYSGDRSGLI
jgi:alcohol dehydrogenase class IV